MIRKALWLVVLVATPSLAQQQPEWTPPPQQQTAPEEPANPQPLTVTPQQPAPQQPPPQQLPPSQQQPPAQQPAQTPPAQQPTAGRPQTAAPSEFVPPPSTQPAPPAEAAGETKVTILPGTPPHSPATHPFSLNDTRNLRVTPGEIGAAGLWHLVSADLGRPGLFHLGVGGEYMSLGNFPVLGASNTRTNGVFAISYVPIEHLEAYVSYGAAANSNNTSSPPLIQAEGDTNLGVVGSLRPVAGLDLGLDLRLLLFPGVGSQSIGQYAAGFAPRALATFDIRDYAPMVPVRLHLNFGFIFDGTGRLTSQSLSPAEEFALGVNKYNRLAFDLGAEVPLPYVTPFLEYGFALPLGSETQGACTGSYTGPDGVCVNAGQAMPQVFGIGVKVTAIQDITPVLGLQFGLTQRVARGIAATQPFNFFFGVSYNLDPFIKNETKLIEKTPKAAAPPPPSTGKVSGIVIDAETKKPIGGALVTVDNGALPPVASDAAAGKFMSYELPAGKVTVSVVKDGYKPAAQDTTVEIGKVASLQVDLVREIRKATITLKASSGKKPVAARFTFEGPNPVVGVTDATGAGTAEVPVGHYHVPVNADGYLSKAKEVDAVEGGQVILDVELTPIPKKPLVEITADKIQIKQQVHFNTNKATILADSFPLLDQVVDAIVRSNIKKIRIEGNTDNVGGKQHNQKLSQDRAQSVKDYLAKNGLDAKSIDVVGNGDAKPVAPNLTARGRELNRRVEFFIVER